MQINSNWALMLVRAVITFMVVMSIAACGNQKSVKFEQVYSGTNGPMEIGEQYFSAQVELDNSWIKQSLNSGDYQKLLDQTDFSRQVIVAFSAGEMESFSGKIHIASVYQYTGSKDLPINLRVKIGVLNSECKVDTISFPFAIAIIERPKEFSPVGGLDVTTFEDQCK